MLQSEHCAEKPKQNQINTNMEHRNKSLIRKSTKPVIYKVGRKGTLGRRGIILLKDDQ